jgi:ankyrin repeat protein
MSFLKKLFNRRNDASIRDLNSRFLNAIPREREPTEEFERKVMASLVELLDKGADIDAKDHLGWSALMRLAIWGYTIPAIALIERGADTGARSHGDTTALQGAAQNSNAQLLKLMVSEDMGAADQKCMSSRLLGSAMGGRVNGEEDREKKIECIDMLLAKGFTFDNPGDQSSAYHCYPYLASYFPGLAEAKEMEAAVRAGDVGKVKELVAGGLKPDCLADFGQDTPLFIAASMGDLPMMEELVKAGADLNIMCSRSDKTPLMAAAESGKIAALDLLVDKGVDIATHYRSERSAYDEPPHIRPNLLDSARKGGPGMTKRLDELRAPTVVLQRRTRIMKPLRLGKGVLGS